MQEIPGKSGRVGKLVQWLVTLLSSCASYYYKIIEALILCKISHCKILLSQYTVDIVEIFVL